MKTKKIVILFLTTLCVVLALMLCSCSLFSGNGSDDKGGGGGDDTKQSSDGWKSTEVEGIYTALLLGGTNVAYQGSQKAIEDNNGVLTIDSKVKLTLNGNSLWVVLKGKYKNSYPKDNTIFSLEICTEETPSVDNRVVAMYMYQNNLYIALGKDFADSEKGKNNKVKVSLSNIAWDQYFPFKMDKLTSGDISAIAGVLSSNIVTNKPNTAEKRRVDGVDEYRYNMDIDVSESVAGLFGAIAEIKSLNMDFIKKAKSFVAVLFGVDESKLLSGQLPASNMKICFETHNAIISSFNIDFDIDVSGTTMLFSNGKMTGNASMEKLTLGKDYKSMSIPFATGDYSAERDKYVSFTGSIFSISIPLDEYKNTAMKQSTLKLTSRFFQGVGQQDLIFAEYRDQSTGKLISGVYGYNNILYFFSAKNDDNEYRCLCSIDVHDLGDLANMIVGNSFDITTEGNQNSFEPSKLLAYIIQGVSIDKTAIRFSIKPSFYTDVWYNFDALCKFVNSMTEENLLEVEGIRDFYNYVTTNEVIMTFRTDVPILNIVNDNDTDFRQVVSMLNAVSEDTRLTPTEVLPTPSDASENE
ncbi:MAG: hypothetical protein J5781_01790 [Clostridia bacterium]|nr:hypothetical protein [Clostridia bacterium]